MLRDSLEAMRGGSCSATSRIVLHRGAGAYICGEETALLESLEGRRGQPRTEAAVPRHRRPLRRADRRQQRRVDHDRASVLELGGEEYAKLGVENSTGTRVFSLSGNVVNGRELRASARVSRSGS